MSDTPKHRRWVPSYSLRTLFVAVTVVAIFIGYHVKWIHDRRIAINGMAPLGEKILPISYDMGFGFQALESPDDPHPNGPGFLWLFGERGYERCVVVFGALATERFQLQLRELSPVEEAEVERIKRLFPEAEITAEATEKWN